MQIEKSSGGTNSGEGSGGTNRKKVSGEPTGVKNIAAPLEIE